MTTLEQQGTLQADVDFLHPSVGEGSRSQSAAHIVGSRMQSVGPVREIASLRNTTVLPTIEQTGGAIRLQPRTEARYQRIRRLGAGAMGEVTLVKDNDIGRTVAVKQLLSPTQNADGIARFIEEIRTIGQLEHPNLVPIHDVGIDEKGQLFFVMKHINGETLEAIMERLAAGDPQTCERYTLDMRIEIFMGLLHALQCAHERGIVHRDIKPANIMIGRFGEVVLMDWGIAKLMPKPGQPECSFVATQQGQLVGTPAYMSPEQASGSVDDIDARSDLYSAAVLLHELLGLQHYLSHCKTGTQVLRAILTEEFRYMRLVFIKHPRHAVPPAELLHFIVKGLEKDPRDRYQSADQMLAELQRIRDGRCRVSCPATLAKRMIDTSGRFVNRYPKLSPFVFYSLLLLLTSYVVISAHLLLHAR